MMRVVTCSHHHFTHKMIITIMVRVSIDSQVLAYLKDSNIKLQHRKFKNT